VNYELTLRKTENVDFRNATFMSLLPKNGGKGEINLALRIYLRKVSYED